MGRELQKKKRRSSRNPVRQLNRSKKILNPRGSVVIAENWDKKETLAQNYRRLGLLARLKAPTGGIEKNLKRKTDTAAAATTTSKDDPFGIITTEKAVISEAKVERDASGKIIRIISRTDNPLNDPLNEFDSDSDADADANGNKNDEHGHGNNNEEWGGIVDDGEPTTDVVRTLIEQSQNPAPKKPRYQSQQEREWLEKLVAAHGDNFAAMARDHRLNPMQQTAADISKRIRKMQG